MPISTDAAIWFFGTQTKVSAATVGTIATGAFSTSADAVDFTNTDDADLAAAVLKYRFNTTFPTAGHIALFARLFDVQGTNDEVDDTDSLHGPLGIFRVAYGQTADVDYYASIPLFRLPVISSQQLMRFRLQNVGTSQTIGNTWELWVTPKAYGPHG